MKKVALIIGHSYKNGGASNSSLNIDEFSFNEILAYTIYKKLKAYINCEPLMIYRDCKYSELPKKVNLTNADIAISLHCNAFNTKVQGSEVLYFENSKNGKFLAGLLQKEIVSCLRSIDRGLKPCNVFHKGRAGDRGGFLLKYTKMPCVIAEPFFIDNDESLIIGIERVNDLAIAYANAVYKYFKELENYGKTNSN